MWLSITALLHRANLKRTKLSKSPKSTVLQARIVSFFIGIPDACINLFMFMYSHPNASESAFESVLLPVQGVPETAITTI